MADNFGLFLTARGACVHASRAAVLPCTGDLGRGAGPGRPRGSHEPQQPGRALPLSNQGQYAKAEPLYQRRWRFLKRRWARSTLRRAEPQAEPQTTRIGVARALLLCGHLVWNLEGADRFPVAHSVCASIGAAARCCRRSCLGQRCFPGAAPFRPAVSTGVCIDGDRF